MFDGEGQWRNPQTGRIVGAPTKILLVAAKREGDLARRLSAVIEAYKTQFHQVSVGIITRDLALGSREHPGRSIRSSNATYTDKGLKIRLVIVRLDSER